MRCIDADALRDRLQNLGYDDWNQGATTTWAEAFSECADMVEEMPTIEPRKKGHWIKISPANIYECSECGKNVMTDDISAYDFCHGCGADMTEDEG
jgi:DNA-directed RNA polymerase subunit RPC12/RpoP